MGPSGGTAGPPVGEAVSVPGRLWGVPCAPRGSGSGAGGRGGRMQSPPRPRGHTDGPDIRTRHQELWWEPARESLGGRARITAGPGACGAPGSAGGGPDSPAWEAQGTVLCALSPWPARRLLGRSCPLGSSLHIPAGGSAVCMGDFSHLCPASHGWAERGAGLEGVFPDAWSSSFSAQSSNTRGVSRTPLKGLSFFPGQSWAPGDSGGPGHGWFLMYRVASLSAARPSEVKQDSPWPPP